jgi:branched-chain amino acid aminotransferase
MDFSKLNNQIYFENKFVKAEKAKIHVLNHSLHFASSVFEGIRVYNSKSLFLNDHIDRLFLSAKLMGLKKTVTKKKLERIIKKLIKVNKIKDGYIRPIIFRSSHSMSPETFSCKSLLAIAVWEWGKLFGKDKGIKLNISKFPKLNNKVYPMQAKSSGSYQTSVISRIDSHKKKYDDCLMLDLKGNIAESSACNIFWVKKNKLYTSKEHSILNGITRKAVIKICEKNKIKHEVGDFKLNHFLKADSIFLTGTAAEIQPIRKVLKHKFNINCEIIKFLKIEYDKLKIDCPKKIDKI